MLEFYFNDSELNNVEYDPSEMEMTITFASGESQTFTFVSANLFTDFTNSSEPLAFFNDVILTDSSIGRS